MPSAPPAPESDGSPATSAKPRPKRGARRRRASVDAKKNANAVEHKGPRAYRGIWTVLGGAATLLLCLALGWGFVRQNTSDTPGLGPLQAAAAERSIAPQSEPLAKSATHTSGATQALAARPVIHTRSIEQLLADTGKPLDWRIARIRSNEALLVIEFPNLLEQGLSFNRAAAFIEKGRGKRDRVLTDIELAALIERSADTVETFYYGHDYSGEQMSQFFTQASAQHLALNAQELRMRAILLDAAVLKEGASSATESPVFYAPGQHAVISFSALQFDDPTTKADEGIDALRRESTLRHELSHGEFFTRPAYQKQSWAFWQKSLGPAERAMFRRMLADMDYDADNELLMVNETQAILMHTPDKRAFDAGNLGVSSAQLKELRERFERSR